jgi:hypothetical protein
VLGRQQVENVEDVGHAHLQCTISATSPERLPLRPNACSSEQ